MKVVIAGLWHLGSVTAACLAASGHDVTGIDPDAVVITRLASGAAPVMEPGLDALVKSGLASGKLRFSSDLSCVAGAAVVWVTYDTPVDSDDRADVEFVVHRVEELFPHLQDGAVVLVSSQVPVGTTARLARMFTASAEGRRVGFGYSPENLRLGNAIDVFTHPDRIVVGTSAAADKAVIETLLRPITDRIEWMSVESAEMTKHALNAFLATSVTFINEVATLCEQVGADASEVARGLKTESRIGPRAYLSPGAAFAGGTLARDIMFLGQLAEERHVVAHVLTSVKASNDVHRLWARRRLGDLLGDLSGRSVAVWGLTYKAGTDTLRRSNAVELCEWVHACGAKVRAHDPAVKALPAELAAVVHLCEDPLSAVDGADALVVATPWPQFRDVPASRVTRLMRGNVVLDAARFLAASFDGLAGVRYVSVGRTVRA